jgi:lysozyme
MGSLKKHEGLRLRSYQDTEGVWTIGYGRNLQSLVIDDETAGMWLAEDAAKAIKEAKGIPEFAFLDTDARQNAFTEMVYNLGAPRLKKFEKMMDAIRKQDWSRVGTEALDSLWAKQVGERARYIATLFISGRFR